MKVKIGETIYDGNEECIMLILNEQDKLNISNMLPNATKFCQFPDSMDLSIVKEFMKTENN